MPAYLEVIYLILAGVAFPTLGFIFTQIWMQRGRLVKLEAEVAALQVLDEQRRLFLENMQKSVHRLDLNVVRIATKLGVGVEES